MANSAITRLQLINYSVYDSAGVNLLGTSDIELPELKFLEADIQGSGVAGKFSSPTLGETDSMELTLNWRSVNSDLLNLSSQKVVDLILYGAEQILDYGRGNLGVQQVKIGFRGIPKTTTLGKFSPGETTDSKNVFETLYLKIEIGGKRALEFDKINFIYFDGLIDRLADVRRALAM